MKKLLIIIGLALILSGFQDKKPVRFTGEIKYSIVDDEWRYKQDVTLFMENGYLVKKQYGEKKYNPSIKRK